MRIGIFGTGGAGGHFGARLARAGEDVVFVARGAHLEAIRREGLAVETPEGEILVRPAVATDDPGAAGPVDAILLGVKTWQVEDAARAMRPMIGAETFVVPLQNGVEAAGQLTAVLGPERVVGGLCATFSFVTAPGRIRSVGQVNLIRLGELDNRPSGGPNGFARFSRAPDSGPASRPTSTSRSGRSSCWSCPSGGSAP